MKKTKEEKKSNPNGYFEMMRNMFEEATMNVTGKNCHEIMSSWWD